MAPTRLFDPGSQPFWGHENMLNWTIRGMMGNDQPGHGVLDLSVPGQTNQHQNVWQPPPPRRVSYLIDSPANTQPDPYLPWINTPIQPVQPCHGVLDLSVRGQTNQHQNVWQPPAPRHASYSIDSPTNTQPDPYLPWINTPIQRIPNIFADDGAEETTILDMTKWSQMDEDDATEDANTKRMSSKRCETTIKNEDVKTTIEQSTICDDEEGSNRANKGEERRKTLQSCYTAMQQQKTLTKFVCTICDTMSELSDRLLISNKY